MGGRRTDPDLNAQRRRASPAMKIAFWKPPLAFPCVFITSFGAGCETFHRRTPPAVADTVTKSPGAPGTHASARTPPTARSKDMAGFGALLVPSLRAYPVVSYSRIVPLRSATIR